MNDALLSSKTVEWETPQPFFDSLNKIYNFHTDVCATPENAKCKNYYTQEQNGLAQEWRGICCMNPPYGREISKWIKKAREAAQQGATVVCLLPARTDTRWFHDHILGIAEITFLRGRLKFGGAKTSAPFPSMTAVFKPTTGEKKHDTPTNSRRRSR